MVKYSLKKLSEICKILKGKNPELFNDERKNSLPYLSAKFIRGTQTPEYALASDKKSVIVDKDEIIIICDGSNSGESFIGFSGILSSTMGKMVHSKEIQNLYLKYFLDVIVDELRDKKTGTAIPHLDIKRLLNSNIPLPPLSVQEEIVAKLDVALASIDEAKTKTQQALAATRELWESTLEEVFRDAKYLGDKKKKLGEVCNFVRGPFGGSLKKQIFVKEGFAVYEQSHAIYNQFNVFRYFIDSKKFEEMKRFRVLEGSLLMSCSGTMGKVSMVPENAPVGIINQALLMLTPKENLLSTFLKFWMESNDFQQKLKDFAGGAAIQNVASVKILKEIIIPLPSILEQSRIVTHLDAVRAETDRLAALYEQKLADLDELRRSVLQEAFAQGA